jgi:hypothetical protein
VSLEAQLTRSSFSVREPCRLDMTIRSSQTLVRGDVIEVQLPNSWLAVFSAGDTRPLQSDNVGSPHYVCFQAAAPQAVFDTRIRPRHLVYPSGPARHGRCITATLRSGSVPAGIPIRFTYANTYAPPVVEQEEVWVRLKGEAPTTPPVLTVTAGPAEALRVIAPSAAEPGVAFDVVVVGLDRYENPAETVFENETLATADGVVVARGLTFTGRTRVPVTLPREGVYRFVFRQKVSNAVIVATGRRGPFWGDLHIHTKLSYDGIGGDPYTYARDVSGLDFAAVTDHWESLGQAGYTQILEWARAGAVPGRFATILGDERNPSEWGRGNHSIYFRSEEAFTAHRALKAGPLFPPEKEGEKRAAPDPAQVMLVPHHTGVAFGDWFGHGTGTAIDWGRSDDRGLRPVAEIYSLHGQSEMYCPVHARSYETNGLRDPDRYVNTSVPGPYYLQDWWMAGHRPGVVAGSDDHTGRGGQRDGAATAVFADSLATEALFDAIRARRCYGTTGERILMEFTVNGVMMGGAVSCRAGDHVRLRVRAWGTAVLMRIEVLRFRFRADSGFTPVASVCPRPESLDADVSFEDRIDGATVYYVRVTQEPVDRPGMAWSSPIWVDVAAPGVRKEET